MDRQIHISFNDATGKNFQFDHLRNLYEFAKQERDFWKPQQENVENIYGVVPNYLNFHTTFQSIIDEIDSWDGELETWTDEELGHRIDNSLSPQLHYPDQYLWSGHPFVKPLIECHVNHGSEAADAFIALVVQNNFPRQIYDKSSFLGVMAGYEFLSQDSDIVKRRNGEKVSLGHLRNQLAAAKENLFREIEGLKTDYNQWYKQVQRTTKQLHSNFEGSSSKQVQEQSEQFNEKLGTWLQTMDELENTYEEKLRLSKPAKYWSDAAKKFRWQGGFLALAIFISVFVGLGYFVEFFTTWLQGQELAIKLNTLQGVVLFSTILAIYAFFIRVLSRLTFSSFHLMRDAEEREQLTYLYLALSKETEIDKETREIVLQALFSRSMTGLLAQEHGPSIPGASDVLGTISQHRK